MFNSLALVVGRVSSGNCLSNSVYSFRTASILLSDKVFIDDSSADIAKHVLISLKHRPFKLTIKL